MQSRLALPTLCLLALIPAQANANKDCFLSSGGSSSSLGTLGGVDCYAYAMNDSGQITGHSTFAPGSNISGHAFLYSAGTMTDLGGSTIASVGFDVNNAGQVVGMANFDYGLPRAFRYSGGVMTDLGTLSPGSSRALLINDAGQVAGETDAPQGRHAFLHEGGVMTDLGVLGSDLSSSPVAMNSSGQVVGVSVSYVATRGFLYSGGVMTDLGTLGGDTFPRAINDAGQVVGVSQTAGGVDHAFLYQGGVMTDLGTLGGTAADSSAAVAINSAGQIVGSSTVSGNTHGFLYDGGIMTDIGNFEPQSINDNGQVMALATDHAVVYAGGVTTDVSLLEGAKTSVGVAINSSGQIAGNQHGVFCPSEPLNSCVPAVRVSLRVKKAAVDSGDRILWNWRGAGDASIYATDQDAMMCVYDSVAGQHTLAAELGVGADGWRPVNDGLYSSYVFADPAGAQDGITKFRLLNGLGARPSAQLLAKGENVPMPLPYSGDRMFNQESDVTVQVVQSYQCWSSEFADADTNTAELFKAKAP